MDFSLAFNSRKYTGDEQGIAVCIIDDDGEDILPSGMPVKLEDFYIQPKQCGLPAPQPKNTISKAHACIFKDYATMSAANNKRRQDFYQQWENKCQQIFGCFGTSDS